MDKAQEAVQAMAKKLLASYKRERKLNTLQFKVMVLEAMCDTIIEFAPPTEKETWKP